MKARGSSICPRGRGLTLVEVVCAIALLAILATIAMPLGRNAAVRRREAELRVSLATMRRAIDRYHQLASTGAIQPWDPDWEYYPPDLETLVEGIEVSSPQAGQVKVEKFLRDIPIDPMTGERDWSLRSYQMDPDDTSWDGKNVFDVRSLSTGVALDGTLYSDW